MKEVLFPGEYVQLTGDTEHELKIPRGDQAVAFSVYSDCEAWLYVHCENLVVPLAHGFSFAGRALVRDAKWLLLRVQKKTAIVAACVTTEERRLTDKNSGKPVAAHIPAPPALDVMAMARRLVGQRDDEPAGLTAEDLEEMFPDDVDTEFGPGFVQLEEDEDIEDAVQARRQRKADERASQNQPTERAGREEGGARESERSSDGGTASKPGGEREKSERAPVTK